MDYATTISSFIAGVIQGLTELLPISSSGHLLLFAEISPLDLAITEIAVLHLGTLASILIVFKDKIHEALSWKMFCPFLVSILPAGILGFLFSEEIDAYLGTTPIISGSLLIWGIALIVGDQWRKKHPGKITKLSEIGPWHALVVGLAQALALIPGTSRSGITILAGMLAGMTPGTALAFSFISGIPLLAASGIFGIADVVGNQASVSLIPLTIAVVSSMVFGILAALALKKFITKGILTYAGVYRILLAVLILIVS